MKIAILGDLHYGIKSFDYIVDKKLNSVFENCIFPHIKKNNIRHIIQLGDVFDDRRGINPESGYNYVKYFLIPIIKNDLTLYQIIGNHDIFYDKNNRINSLKMFFKLINLKLIEDYEKVILGKKELYLVSYGSQIDLSNIYGDVLFGHFAIEGFEMQKNIPVMNGMKKSIFSNFEYIFSGHIHRRDVQKNIYNVGSLVECNFGESDFIHGFYVLDTENMNIEFIPIEEKIFIRITPNEIDKYKNLNNVAIELKIDEEESEIKNEKIIKELQRLNPVDVKIRYINKKKEEKKIEIENYDFLSVLKEYVENDDSNMKSDILLKLVMKFYNDI